MNGRTVISDTCHGAWPIRARWVGMDGRRPSQAEYGTLASVPRQLGLSRLSSLARLDSRRRAMFVHDDFNIQAPERIGDPGLRERGWGADTILDFGMPWYCAFGQPFFLGFR